MSAECRQYNGTSLARSIQVLEGNYCSVDARVLRSFRVVGRKGQLDSWVRDYVASNNVVVEFLKVDDDDDVIALKNNSAPG